MKSVLAGIVAFILSIFGGHQAATDSALNTAAAAAPASVAPSAIVVAASSTNPTTATSTAASTTIVYQPVIERIVEQATSTGISETYLNARLDSLDQSLRQFVSQTASAPIFSGSSAPLSVESFAPSQRIDQLANVTISNPTITGGSVPASAITGTISAAINSALAVIDDLTTTKLVAVNATTTNLYALNASIVTATTTNLHATNLNAANSTSTNFFATTASSTNLFSANGNIGVLSAGNLTLSSTLNVSGLSTFAGFISTASSTIGGGTQTGGLTISGGATTTGTAYFAGNVGIGNVSPNYLLEVNGQAAVRNNTSGGTFPAVTLGASGGDYGYVGYGFKVTGSAGIYSHDSNSDSVSAIQFPSGGFKFRTAPAGTAGTPITWTDAMSILQGGNVGIGTASPGYKLEVAGTGYFSDNVSINGWDMYNHYLSLRPGFGTAQPSLSAYDNGSGHNDSLRVNGYAGIGFFLNDAEKARFDSSGNFGIGGASAGARLYVKGPDTGTGVALQVADSNGSQRLTVLDNGKVGVGTTNPTSPAGVPVFLDVNNGGNVGGSSLVLHDNDANGKAYELISSASGGSGYFGLYDGSAYRLWVNSSGNVGIGTTTPNDKLDVVGGIRVGNGVQTGGIVGGYGLLVRRAAGDSVSYFQMVDENSVTHTIASGGSGHRANLVFTNDASGNYIFNTGNVGIGTTSPAIDANTSTFLTLDGGTSNYGEIAVGKSQTGTAAAVGGVDFFNSNLGTADKRIAAIWSQTDGSTNSGNLLFYTYNSGTNNERMRIDKSGNVGIGLTTATNIGRLFLTYTRSTQQGIDIIPDADSGGGHAILFSNAAQGAVGSVDTNGTNTTYNTSSDRRIKENIATTTAGLATLLQIPVRDFNFISDPTHAKTQGFIAQELQPFYPYAVTTNGDNGIDALGASSTPWQVDYGRLTPLLAKAVQDIANVSSAFEKNLIAWLGNAANGIGDLFANNIHAQNKLCVGGTCITESQFQAMVAAANASQSSGQTPSASQTSSTPPATGQTVLASSTPPVIAINGENPAHIHVGDKYADLGATITGPPAALNLGIKTFLNGALVSDIVLDTSTAATDTIDYVATDQADNTATSTRTVIVEAPAFAAPPQLAPDASAATSSATSTAQ